MFFKKCCGCCHCKAVPVFKGQICLVLQFMLLNTTPFRFQSHIPEQFTHWVKIYEQVSPQMPFIHTHTQHYTPLTLTLSPCPGRQFNAIITLLGEPSLALTVGSFLLPSDVSCLFHRLLSLSSPWVCSVLEIPSLAQSSSYPTCFPPHP